MYDETSFWSVFFFIYLRYAEFFQIDIQVFCAILWSAMIKLHYILHRDLLSKWINTFFV